MNKDRIDTDEAMATRNEPAGVFMATINERRELEAFVARKTAKIVDYKTTLWATAAFLAALIGFVMVVPIIIAAIKLGQFLWGL